MAKSSEDVVRMNSMPSALAPETIFENYIPEENLLTAQEVARKLSVSPKTVYKLAKTKRLRSVTIGKSVRFFPEDVAEIRRGQRNL